MRATALTAWAVLLASPAMAAPSVWLKCDGLPQPEGTGALLGRVVVLSGSFGLLGRPETPQWGPLASGAQGVQACAEALATTGIDQFWARKSYLLEARAVHHAEAGDADSALADLKSAIAAGSGHGDDRDFDRSVGLSASPASA